MDISKILAFCAGGFLAFNGGAMMLSTSTMSYLTNSAAGDTNNEGVKVVNGLMTGGTLLGGGLFVGGVYLLKYALK